MTDASSHCRLIAIDPSLTCSGWALFSFPKGGLIGVGKIKSIGPSHPLPSRLRNLQEKIEELVSQLGLGREDVLICEAPTTMRDPRAAIKVEQVRSIFEAVARHHRLAVPGRINPRSVHTEIMGLRGKQQTRSFIKRAAAQMVHALFATPLGKMGFESSLQALRRHQDITDAILVGHLAVAKLRAAIRTGASLDQSLLPSGAAAHRQHFSRKGRTL